MVTVKEPVKKELLNEEKQHEKKMVIGEFQEEGVEE